MRMRFQSPMLTTSDTAPMVQKCVLLETAPKTNARANAPQTTFDASAAGSGALKRAAVRLLSRQALLGLLGRGAGGILLDERAQRLARLLALAELRLRARDVEQ